MDSKATKTLDPILTIQASLDDETATPRHESSDVSKAEGAVTSLCFIDTDASRCNASWHSTDESDSDDSDYKPLALQCGNLLSSEKDNDADATASAREVSARLSLAGRLLGTCQANGSCLLWDLGQRKVLQHIASRDRGPGLLLRRLEQVQSNSRFIYQTRDGAGTVSMHDLNGSVVASTDVVHINTLAKFNTFSQSLCASAPCHGNSNLIVMPTSDHSCAMVRDWRLSPDDHPVALFHGSYGLLSSCAQAQAQDSRKHGMLTSLAMVESNGKCTIACGMESGVVAVHDLAMLKSNSFDIRHQPFTISLGKDPVLSLDLASSSSTISKHSTLCSVVAIAGLAGHVEDLTDLPEADRGRVAVVKATMRQTGEFTAQLRSRLPINNAVDNSNVHNIKPGVAICRFRPDGRMFVVGGWDYRLRIYDRSASSTPAGAGRQLAVLRGHCESVNASDWASDAAESGLLATGSSDGRIQIWRVFPTVTGRI